MNYVRNNIFVRNKRYRGYLQHESKVKTQGTGSVGYHAGGGIILGHSRLSIIDVDGGKQPIYNETGDKCIVCNGEIYNYRELKKQFLAIIDFLPVQTVKFCCIYTKNLGMNA